jgi:carboxyl-terminal processing protease
VKPQRIVLWITAFFLVGIFVGLSFRESISGSKGSSMDQFFQYLQDEYVDTLDIAKLQQQAMDYILSGLDPHSVLIPVEDEQQIAERMQGSFSGVGVEFTIYEDTLVFVYIMEGGPAESYGLKAGDRIYAIDGDTIVGEGLTNEFVTQKIKGPVNTYVTFDIIRDGLPLVAAVQRDFIPLNSVSGAQMYGSMGYVKVDRFAESTTEELQEALAKLDDQGMRGLILDLRDNPGGYLHEAVEIADLFLDGNKTIVSTKYKDGRTIVAESKRGDKYEDLPLHIILNDQSASASEVLSGALQDHDRATIYGTTSFGKGLVQEDKQLPDGSTIRLTVAYYYTPSGRSIQKPYAGADLPGEMEGLVFQSDSGKILSSVGGIEPDIELSNDTVGSYYWGFSFGTIDDFAFQWVDARRKKIGTWEYEDFFNKKVVDDELISEFLKYGGYGLYIEDLPMDQLTELRLMTKAAIAKNIWGFDAYVSMLLNEDPVLKEVIKLSSGTLQ